MTRTFRRHSEAKHFQSESDFSLCLEVSTWANSRPQHFRTSVTPTGSGLNLDFRYFSLISWIVQSGVVQYSLFGPSGSLSSALAIAARISSCVQFCIRSFILMFVCLHSVSSSLSIRRFSSPCAYFPCRFRLRQPSNRIPQRPIHPCGPPKSILSRRQPPLLV